MVGTLFTLGNPRAYEPGLYELGEDFWKLGMTDTYPGGCVFLSVREAEQHRDANVGYRGFAVYRLLTDITNTYLDENGRRHIIDCCQIVRL